MLKALRISAMLLALVGTAHAGDIFTPPIAPPTQNAAVEQPPSEDLPTDDTSGTLKEIALELFALLPSLF